MTDKMELRNDKEIQSEVSRSLEMLDDVLKYCDQEKGDNSNLTLRGLKHVPADARHSLVVLDDILAQFDAEVNEEVQSRSSADLKHLEDLPLDVSKSLDDLDNVLDEFEKEGGLHSFKRRRPANRNDSQRKPRNDDIRRSLEVLDNVLAEFDDCLDCWEPMPSLSSGNESTAESQLILDEKGAKEKQVFSLQEDSIFSFECFPTDSSTSHNYSDQAKISSAPPIPKRSPTTKLTGDRNSGLFVFPADTSSLDSYDSIPSDSFAQDSDLSGAPLHLTRQAILSSANEDEPERAACVSSSLSSNGTMESKNSAGTLSPFMQRKKMFEEKIAEAGSKSPVLDRYRHASLKVRKRSPDYDDNSGPLSLSSSLSPESGFASDESPSQSFRNRPMRPPNLVKVTPPSVDLPTSSSNHAINCKCQLRIQQLNVKFAETRRLLKQNKIKALNKNPPSFVPPPPQVFPRNKRERLNEGEKENFSKPSALEISRSKSFECLRSTNNFDVNDARLRQEKYKVLSEKSSNLKTEVSCLSCSCSSKNRYLAESSLFENRSSFENINGSGLCRTCSRSVPTPLSETIEDISNLLPTDALNRPHLGLSYSMEDDLSPGVKEIRNTSTPKTDLSNGTRHKDPSGLSTFSLSASSLGYISSQSDLELNNSLTECDKVPVTSLRSQTLPIGVSLTPSPFYSASDSSHPSDHNDNLLIGNQNLSHSSLGADLQLRSCSAPPLPEAEKTKKHFRAFSRKEKKDKKKNEDNLSLKSHTSLDEGVILKKIETLDGATDEKRDGADRMGDSGVEKKRWSAWRSILRKK